MLIYLDNNQVYLLASLTDCRSVFYDQISKRISVKYLRWRVLRKNAVNYFRKTLHAPYTSGFVIIFRDGERYKISKPKSKKTKKTYGHTFHFQYSTLLLINWPTLFIAITANGMIINNVDGDDKLWLMMMMMKIMMMNCFCGMVDWRKKFSLISSRDHCQRSSPSRISGTQQTGFETGFESAQNLSSSLVEWKCAVVITTAPHSHS